MPTYRKRSTVEARRAEMPGVADTAWGPIPYEIGDWLVTNPDGETYPVGPGVFARDYELVPEEVR
jgi:hypothetical protein